MELIWVAVRDSFLSRAALGISIVGESVMKLIRDIRLTDCVLVTLKIICLAQLEHYEIFSDAMLKIEKVTSQMQNKVENVRAVREHMESC